MMDVVLDGESSHSNTLVFFFGGGLDQLVATFRNIKKLFL